jgi:hypothetical protein
MIMFRYFPSARRTAHNCGGNQGIEAQGFWGTVTTNKLEKVVINNSRVSGEEAFFYRRTKPSLRYSKVRSALSIATLLLKRGARPEKAAATDFA